MLGGVYVLHTFVFFLIIIKGVNEGLQGKVSYLRFYDMPLCLTCENSLLTHKL